MAAARFKRYIASSHREQAMKRPSQPLRLLLAAALMLGVAMLTLTLLRATDAALSVWDRLQAWPEWVRIGFAALMAALVILALWGVWRLLRPRAARTPRAAVIDRSTLEARIERIGASVPEGFEARGELGELDRRRAEGAVQACLFGQISTGKSSLLKALAPDAAPEIGAVGGSTRRISRHRGLLPDGRTLEIADVPGSFEADDSEHIALARAEAARSHALIYVVDADISRSQRRELAALAQFGRPLVLVLNKADRYTPAELKALTGRLTEEVRELGAEVIRASAGHAEEVVREHHDGRHEIVRRERPAQVDALQRALARIAGAGAQALEPGREAALFAHIDERLAEGERREQQERSDKAIERYTRRAVIGALAAVAPGTDLVIQGALATALTRELCQIHGLRARDVDIDDLLSRAGGLLRTGSSITLAVVGNALKAFPGFGTLGGGLVHAVAYGLIFDSLGHALADTLANARELDRDATLTAFRQRLAAPSAERLLALARMALQERDAPEPAAGTDRP